MLEEIYKNNIGADLLLFKQKMEKEQICMKCGHYNECFPNICENCGYEIGAFDSFKKYWEEFIIKAKINIEKINEINPHMAEQVIIILQKLRISFLGG